MPAGATNIAKNCCRHSPSVRLRLRHLVAVYMMAAELNSLSPRWSGDTAISVVKGAGQV